MAKKTVLITFFSLLEPDTAGVRERRECLCNQASRFQIQLCIKYHSQLTSRANIDFPFTAAAKAAYRCIIPKLLDTRFAQGGVEKCTHDCVLSLR